MKSFAEQIVELSKLVETGRISEEEFNIFKEGLIKDNQDRAKAPIKTEREVLIEEMGKEERFNKNYSFMKKNGDNDNDQPVQESGGFTYYISVPAVLSSIPLIWVALYVYFSN